MSTGRADAKYRLRRVKSCTAAATGLY